MAGTIRPNDIAVTTSPTLSASALPSLDITSSAKKPSIPRTPRIDVEPLYSAVKSAISDADWTLYKKTIAFFLLGNLNQEELSRRLKHILHTRELEHAHNSLVAAIYANIWRDAPDAGIATWVSSSDKPSLGQGSKGTHDESEKRLKVEVMGLSRRERKRLKGITAGEGPKAGAAQDRIDARVARQIDTSALQTQGGNTFGKTNWDIEILKRYTHPLSLETHEFPTPTSISARLLPICYESGLPQGASPEIPDFLNIATETYIKEALSSLLQKVSKNGAGYVRTAEFKRRVAREERLVEKSLGVGGVVRGPGGELPVEAEERRKRKLLCMEDVRLALQLGDGYLGQTPFVAGMVMNSRFLDTRGIEEVEENRGSVRFPYGQMRVPGINGDKTTMHNTTASKVNGVNVPPYPTGDTWTVAFLDSNNNNHSTSPITNSGTGAVPNGPGTNGTSAGEDRMHLDEENTWLGGSVQDVRELEGALDEILSLGDM